jgi:hypothetical protein
MKREACPRWRLRKSDRTVAFLVVNTEPQQRAQWGISFLPNLVPANHSRLELIIAIRRRRPEKNKQTPYEENR